VSFVVLAVFVVVNLFIAIVINNLEAVKREEQAPVSAENGRDGLATRLDAIDGRLAAIEAALCAPGAASAGRPGA
jgi:hypothetical protein